VLQFNDKLPSTDFMSYFLYRYKDYTKTSKSWS